MEHNFERLKAHILPLSQSKNFDIARAEWKLIGVEVSEEFDNCPCGQEIKEHCYIENRLNSNRTYVGNVCIKRFMGIDTGNLFEGLKRIAADETANPNYDVIMYAQERGFLYGDRELQFLLSTKNKRKLSAAQIAWKRKINRRILKQTVVSRRSGI